MVVKSITKVVLKLGHWENHESMDAILNQCFAENLFKMPALCGRRRTNKAEILTLNEMKYTEEVKLILENQRLNKEGMGNLTFSLQLELKMEASPSHIFHNIKSFRKRKSDVTL